MTDSEDFSAGVAREVKRWVNLRGLSQSDVATLLGISPQAMSRRVSGETPYALDELNVLAQALGVRIAVFVGEPPKVGELRSTSLPEPPQSPTVRPRRGRKLEERRPTTPKVHAICGSRNRAVTSRYNRVHLRTLGESTHTRRAA